MLSFTLSGNISMNNHQWRLSQAYTYAFHISIHISIIFNSFSSYIPIACQYFSITCSISLAYPLLILFLYSYFEYFTYSYLIMSLVYVFFIFRFYVFYCILYTVTYIISFLIYHKYFAYFLSLAYIVYLIYFILFLVSCSLQVSYAFMSRILSYNLSYTILYVYLHSYTFHIW